MCDIIADSILDAYLEKDPAARVACEVIITTGIVVIMGEISSKAVIDINKIVRKTINKIGYNSDKFGFNSKTCAIFSAIDKQSEDIEQGILSSGKNKKQSETRSKNCISLGAGDQGVMFGYACNETKTYMPMPIYYANELCKKISHVRRNNIIDYLGPDGKSMVVMEYDNDKFVRTDTIVVSVQHLPHISNQKIQEDILKEVIEKVIPNNFIDHSTKILINPSGRFCKGGPCADTGLTGRKIIVDTYGGASKHGGGAFSGKDPTKVDRTGAYAARYISKNIVASEVAEKCEVQIAYAIGIPEPISVAVDTFNTSKYSNYDITQMVYKLFDLTPSSLINQFNLQCPQYENLAAFGHFGRNELDCPWELTDKTNQIKAYFNSK